MRLRQTGTLMIAFLLATSAVISQAADETRGESAGIRASAWDEMVRENPDVRRDGSIGPLERDVLSVLTRSQAEAWWDGADPSTLWLEDGSTLEDYLSVALIPAPDGLVYHSLPMCTIANTEVAGGAFEPPETRDYTVSPETADLSGQGGSSTGCGVPSTAEAVVVNVMTFLRRSGIASVSVYESGGDGGDAMIELRPLTRYASSAVTTAVAADAITVDTGSPGDSAEIHVSVSVLGYFDAGPTGPAGPQGVPGEMGPQGVQGKLGPEGAPGATGPQGVQGKLGSEGVPGAAGPSGATGPSGAIGPSGATGPQGVTGPQGLTGPQGATGPQGVQGKLGSQGVQGKLGPQGAQGKLGPQGDPGPRGDPGTVGALDCVTNEVRVFTDSGNAGDQTLACPVDRVVTGGGCDVDLTNTSGFDWFLIMPDGNGFRCKWKNNTALNSLSVKTIARCCKIVNE